MEQNNNLALEDKNMNNDRRRILYCCVNITVRRCGMIVNELTLHQRPSEIKVQTIVMKDLCEA